MSPNPTKLNVRHLEAALQIYPLSIWLALWRAMELALLSQVELVEPVLDLGCSTGLFTYTLLRGTPDPRFDAHTYHRVTYHPAALQTSAHTGLIGLDLDIEAISRARKLHLYGGLLHGNAEQLPFVRGTFSTVISNCVVEHLPDLDALLVQVSNVLREDGRFVFTVPTDTYGQNLILSTLYRQIGRFDLSTRCSAKRNRCLRHINTLSLAQWEHELDRVGLEIVDSQYYLLPHAERLWDLLYMIETSWSGRYAFAVAERVYAWAWLWLPFLDRLKRIWVRLLVRLLTKYHQASMTNGGGLLILAVKKGAQRKGFT